MDTPEEICDARLGSSGRIIFLRRIPSILLLTATLYLDQRRGDLPPRERERLAASALWEEGGSHFIYIG